MNTASTLPVPAPLPESKPDFPTWLPPMLVKELRQGLRTKGFVSGFVFFQVVMAVLMIGLALAPASADGSVRASVSETINGIFWAILAVQLLIVTPMRAIGGLHAEIETRSLDMLVLTRLTAWRIVFGKWASLVAQATLLLIAMLPYGIVRYFVGSVDLVRDASIGALMLGGCAVITAAGLAVSGVSKIGRVAFPVAAFILFQVLVFGRVTRAMRGGTSTTLLTFSNPLETALGIFNGALLLVFCLMQAVRRIAPAAENHSLLARGVPLLSLLPVPFLDWAGKINAARGQFVFAAIFLAIVCAIELASTRLPMLAHWRRWARSKIAGRIVGRLLLPGWPSALLFTLTAGAAAMTCGAMVASRGDAGELMWIVLLGLTMLAFPAVVISWFVRAQRRAGAWYVSILLVGGVLAVLAAIGAQRPWHLTELKSVIATLPIAGFWLSLDTKNLTTGVLVGQAGFVTAVVLVAWARSRYYWRQLAALSAPNANPHS